ncbi:hypothetical protein ACFXG4_48225 [Nocardia sp. NPDC059246]|uniref:hypothetical protein n=1 Tax=unclassified Nocardia TaxID=2637762 RepID=UPI00367C3CC9
MTDIAPLAASTRAVFGDPGVHAVIRSGRTVHAVIRSGRTVHAVSLGQWIGDEEVPELLCHTGVAGWSPTALAPTRAESHLRTMPAQNRRIHLFIAPASAIRRRTPGRIAPTLEPRRPGVYLKPAPTKKALSIVQRKHGGALAAPGVKRADVAKAMGVSGPGPRVHSDQKDGLCCTRCVGI